MALSPGHCPLPRSTQVTLVAVATSCELDTPGQSLTLGPAGLPVPGGAFPPAPTQKGKAQTGFFRAVLVLPEREAPKLFWYWALAAPALHSQCGFWVVESSHSRWVMQYGQDHNNNTRNAKKTQKKQNKRKKTIQVFQAS